MMNDADDGRVVPLRPPGTLHARRAVEPAVIPDAEGLEIATAIAVLHAGVEAALADVPDINKAIVVAQVAVEALELYCGGLIPALALLSGVAADIHYGDDDGDDDPDGGITAEAA